MKHTVQKRICAVLTASLLTASFAALQVSAKDFVPSEVNAKHEYRYNLLLGTNINVDSCVSRSDWQDYLYDPTRGIKVIDTMVDPHDPFKTIQPRIDNVLRTYGGSYEYNETGICCLANMERTYDYFKGLGYTPSQPVYAAVNSESAISSSSRTDKREEAKCTSVNGSPVLMFGIGSADTTKESATYFQGCDLDIVTHEYMHMITCTRFGWEYGNLETQALGEAYSDIMAELRQTNPDWKVAADSYIKNRQRGNKAYCLRDLADPSRTNCPELPNNYNFTTYPEMQASSRSVTPGECSTVISHAAYLMYQKGLTAETLRKIWFASLDYLNPATASNATFADCKTAVCAAALDYFRANGGRYYMSGYLTVMDAFYEVGLE